MGLHKINKGLDLPIAGEPGPEIGIIAQPRRVALMADDYVGMKPTMHVAVGDDVRRGQLLFEDKKCAGVRHTSPVSGRVEAIHRGERRAFQSLVLRLDASASAGRADSVSFGSFSGKHPSELSGDKVRELLLDSGLWTALRSRPFSRVADPAARPHSIFVTAVDTQPLAPAPERVIAGREQDFERGLEAAAKLTTGPVHVCKGPAGAIPVPARAPFEEQIFTGRHPAGTVGLHIHRVDPVDRNKVVWHLSYQDVLAIGKLFAAGELDATRVISLAGPALRRPRLVRTLIGASTDELVERELNGGENRVISGSVLSGRTASGGVFGYLGRYHLQVSVLPEDRREQFLGWLSPGFDKFSTVNTFLSKLIPGKRFRFTTAVNGSDRAMVPLGMYERVMPMDIPPTFLLRALLVGDVERAEELGVLELDEEDLALCTFVCPSKAEYGPLLRRILTVIEKEG